MPRGAEVVVAEPAKTETSEVEAKEAEGAVGEDALDEVRVKVRPTRRRRSRTDPTSSSKFRRRTPAGRW